MVALHMSLLYSARYYETMRTIRRDCVVGLIYSRDGKVLLGMKSPKSGGVYIDCWHLPGGGIDRGETQAEALTREMAEEVGLDISNAEEVTFVDDKGKGESKKLLKETSEMVWCKMHFYTYRITFNKDANDIATRAGDDLQSLKWVYRAKLRDYKLTPPTFELLHRIGE
jgi:ADP-ribose pyrophosphatase YjhB (NUDIX family)